MANHKSAIKRHSQSEKKRIANRQFKSNMNTQKKKANEEIANSTSFKDASAVKIEIGLLAKASQKGILHKKNAARKISRLMKKVVA